MEAVLAIPAAHLPANGFSAEARTAAGGKDDAAARCFSALPGAALSAIVSALPYDSRLRLRLTCRTFADAAADSFSAVCVDARDLRAGGAAAASALSRACPRASRAVVRAPCGTADADGAASCSEAAAAALAVLIPSKPRLEQLQLKDHDPSWSVVVPSASARWLPALMAALSQPPAAAAALPRLRRLELSLNAAPSAEDLSLLRGLPDLRELALRLVSPHRPGVSPDGLREIGELVGLEVLTVPIDTTRALQAWSAVCGLALRGPVAATLTSLQLRCTGASAIELPPDWLLRLPHLRRLVCGHGVSLDLSELEETLEAATQLQQQQQLAAGAAAAPEGAGGPSLAQLSLPPLEHLELDQEDLDDRGWGALAGPRLLGATLTSLSLSRCRPPPERVLSPAPRAPGAPAAPRPFPALRRLLMGVTDPAAALAAAAALTGLRDLSLHHLRCGDRGFGLGAPWRLEGVRELTRLVLLPVTAEAMRLAQAAQAAQAARAAPGRGGGCGVQPNDLWPLMVTYEGPPLIKSCDLV